MRYNKLVGTFLGLALAIAAATAADSVAQADCCMTEFYGNLASVSDRFQPAADVSAFREFPDVPGWWGAPLAGWIPSLENGDFCATPDHICSQSIEIYKWCANSGLDVVFPGEVGVWGGPGEIALVIHINAHHSVRFDGPNSVYNLAGWKACGEVWDLSQPGGDMRQIDRVASHLLNHFIDRTTAMRAPAGDTRFGRPGQYRGNCDNPDNCTTVRYVVVFYSDWDKGTHVIAHGTYTR